MDKFARVVVFIFDLLGNEFTTQLFVVSLMFAFVFKKRDLFWLRYLGGWAVIAGTQWLQKFGYLPIPTVLNYVFVLALLFGVVMLSFRMNVLQALFFIVCAHGVQYIISNITYIIIYIIMFAGKDPSLYVYYYLEMPIVFIGCLFGAYFTVVRRLRKYDDIAFNSITIACCGGAFVVVAIFLSYFLRNAIWYSLNGLIYSLSIAALFVVATLVICMMNISHKKLEKENTVLQELLRKDKRRYEQAKLSEEKIMIKYHDIKQREHCGVVNYEELAEVESDREILNSTYFTGNSALDVVLSEKALLCERLGIRLICTADGETMDFMKPHHIYSLVGNALENAVESVRKESDDGNREITLSVVRHENMCVFSTRNYTSRKVQIKNGLPLTVKADVEEHGFGTRSMKNVVEKYGGQITFYQEGDIFSMTAVIPIPETEKENTAKA